MLTDEKAREKILQLRGLTKLYTDISGIQFKYNRQNNNNEINEIEFNEITQRIKLIKNDIFDLMRLIVEKD